MALLPLQRHDGHTTSKPTSVVYFAKELTCKYKYLGALIIYSILKIILKEREERKQQRLQENAVSPALAGDDVHDVESGDDLALEQGEPAGTSSWLCLQLGQTCSRTSGIPPAPPLRMQKFSDTQLDSERLLVPLLLGSVRAGREAPSSNCVASDGPGDLK